MLTVSKWKVSSQKDRENPNLIPCNTKSIESEEELKIDDELYLPLNKSRDSYTIYKCTCIKQVQEGENETREFLLKFTVHVVNRCWK